MPKKIVILIMDWKDRSTLCPWYGDECITDETDKQGWNIIKNFCYHPYAQTEFCEERDCPLRNIESLFLGEKEK